MCGGFCQQRGYNHKYGQDSGKLPPGFQSCPCPGTYKVEVFRYPQIPWKATGFESYSPEVKFVPLNITMRDLMQRLCLKNNNPSKNIIIQLAHQNYDQFSKKIEIRGDNSERMSMRLSDLEQNRGQSSGQPDIWIWVSDSGMH